MPGNSRHKAISLSQNSTEGSVMGDAGWTLSFLLNACACGAGGKFFIPGLQNPREHSSSRDYTTRL